MIVIMAWRNIWRNKMRSVIIMLSIAIGLFSGIAVLALYEGMIKSRVRTVIDAETGHIQLHHPEFKKDYEPEYIITNGPGILKELSLIPAIEISAPRSITYGMLSTVTGSAGVQINGVQPSLEYRASHLKMKTVEGSGFAPGKKNEVLVGQKLAVKMKLKLRSKLVLTFTDTASNIVSAAFRVAGIYKSENAPLDEKNVYVNISELNTLLQTPGSFHEIVVLLKDDLKTDLISQHLATKFPDNKIETWRQISPETNLMVRTTDEYSYIIMIIIMFALAFGIINTMLMAVLERTREIGMMVALGMTRVRVFLLIFLETIFLTLAGTPFGLFIGWAASEYFNKHGLDLTAMGTEMMSSFGFSTVIYPEFPIDKLFNVLLIVSTTAVLSCIFPALKALGLQPVDALRR